MTLWLHRLQYARLPCPSPTPGVCSNSCPLSRWCHSIISSSVVPFSCPQSFPESGSFGCKVGSSHKVAKELELRLQHQALQWKFRVDFLSYTDTVWRNYSLPSHTFLWLYLILTACLVSDDWAKSLKKKKDKDSSASINPNVMALMGNPFWPIVNIV